jgi:hypothetical protein
MQASQALVEYAGGAWDASLNYYSTGEHGMVTTVQVDEWVYVVGRDGFAVSRYALDEWLIRADQDIRPQTIEADTAEQAWELLKVLREDALVWQCGACDAWIFTSNRPRIGVLQCSTCGDGGIDFRHADRAVGGSD